MSYTYHDVRANRVKREERKERLQRIQTRRKSELPTQAEIDEIPVAPCVEYELSDKETRQLRSRLYAINHDKKKRFRTLRDGNRVIVWRIE